MSLPTDDKARKALPIFRGPMMYFPDALLALAAVCKAGNDQHNPGEPLHWAREKSTEQMDTAVRHMMDHGTGTKVDTDGMYHLAKAAWRVLAELQLTIEEAQGRITRDKNGAPQPAVRRESRTDETAFFLNGCSSYECASRGKCTVHANRPASSPFDLSDAHADIEGLL